MLTHNGKIAVFERDPKTWRRGKKRKRPAMAQVIVTPPKLKPGRLKRVIRLHEQTPDTPNDNGQEQPKRSAIVEPKRKRSSIFGAAPELTEEEIQRRGDAADALWRELVRRAALPEGE